MQPIAAPLLQWFDANKRLLPFRQEPSAYHIWVSEIMLQQTRVAAAIPYYERFIAALPDPAALAACEPDALRKLWQGLGYYNRVNNMQKAARIVCEQYGGDLPADYDALRSLPGIGDYTAGAVASIAFGIPVPAVDGNVLRVFARLYNDDADVMAPATKKAFTVRVLDQMPKATPGPYNEALMELGALVCIPGTPHCEECPLADLCRGYAAGRADQLPVKPAPKAKGKVPVTVALIESEQGFCYMENLVMKDCKLLNTNLAFEYSTVDVEINSNIDSVKNPIHGRIIADHINEIIFDNDEMKPEDTTIIQRKQ